MAKKSGDIALSTFRKLMVFMIASGHTKDAAEEFLFSMHDKEDGEGFACLSELCDKHERERLGFVPGKVGRKSEVDETAIADKVLASFIIGGAPMTRERLEAMPPGMKEAFGKRIEEAVKEERSKIRAAKKNAEIMELAHQFSTGAIDTLPPAA